MIVPTTLLIATTNPGKIAEIAAQLEGLNYRVIGLKDLPEMPPDVEETGATFEENAVLKADAYHAQTGLLTLADDSGLVVDALDGRPGVYSARYGGAGRTSAEQVALLLDELRDTPPEKRTARFVCCIALTGGNLRRTFERSCEGRIALEPRGQEGFGYDPVFLDPEQGRTFAELTRDEKAARSHRGKALRAAREFLASLTDR
ncbi:MAG: RdgB/HAM1 family non-canonical purine NTP pyrophosphatase [Blastocatellia bacterium]|nr:RdgB/HAM1 family non-canonical purine NTP pyrophosphatase [Blastocatellia bacterium]